MRELIPEMGAGPIDRSALTPRQRAVLTDHERLDTLVRRLRLETHRHDHL